MLGMDISGMDVQAEFDSVAEAEGHVLFSEFCSWCAWRHMGGLSEADTSLQWAKSSQIQRWPPTITFDDHHIPGCDWRTQKHQRRRNCGTACCERLDSLVSPRPPQPCLAPPLRWTCSILSITATLET